MPIDGQPRSIVQELEAMARTYIQVRWGQQMLEDVLNAPVCSRQHACEERVVHSSLQRQPEDEWLL